MGSYNGEDEFDFPMIERFYDDLSSRHYSKSAAMHRTITLPLTAMSKAKRDTLVAFYLANRKLVITLWAWPDATAIGAGVSHNARIVGPLKINNASSCRFNTQLTFRLLD